MTIDSIKYFGKVQECHFNVLSSSIEGISFRVQSILFREDLFSAKIEQLFQARAMRIFIAE